MKMLAVCNDLRQVTRTFHQCTSAGKSQRLQTFCWQCKHLMSAHLACTSSLQLTKHIWQHPHKVHWHRRAFNQVQICFAVRAIATPYLSTYMYQTCSWIIMWNNDSSVLDNSIDAACAEAEAATQGRFNGTCTAIFGSVFTGFSAQVIHL